MKTFFSLVLLACFSCIPLLAQVPSYRVTVNGSAATGYYLLSPFSYTVSGKYQFILDGSGTLIYYRKLNSYLAWDYKLQPNGQFSYFYQGGGISGFILLDASFRPVDTIKAVGVNSDAHELRILPNGHYLILASENSIQDLSSYNYFHGNPGSHTANVRSCVIQELDKNKSLVFDWHAKDHFAFNSVDSFWMSSGTNVDWTHSNALELDNDGNILLSSRYFNEITKINRTNGAVMWRFGGKYNQFTFTTDSVRFYGQHDIRRLANGHISLFDDGNHFIPHAARALEYELDETNKTAKLVWSYAYDQNMYSTSMGNVQRLADSNTLVSYGTTPTNAVCFNVVDTLGTELFKLSFIGDFYSYRCFYYPSLPATLPRAQLVCFDSLGVKYLRTQQSYESYEWSDGSRLQFRAVTSAGKYFVYTPYGLGGQLRSEEVVVTDLSTFCNNSTAVSTVTAQAEGKIFPNPARNELTYVFGKKAGAEVPRLGDISGRNLALPGTWNASKTQYTLEVSMLPPGFYFLIAEHRVLKVSKN